MRVTLLCGGCSLPVTPSQAGTLGMLCKHFCYVRRAELPSFVMDSFRHTWARLGILPAIVALLRMCMDDGFARRHPTVPYYCITILNKFANRDHPMYAHLGTRVCSCGLVVCGSPSCAPTVLAQAPVGTAPCGCRCIWSLRAILSCPWALQHV